MLISVQLRKQPKNQLYVIEFQIKHSSANRFVYAAYCVMGKQAKITIWQSNSH